MADFEFQPEKALAVTSFLAMQTGETMYTILKMVYVADRLHLERYGRPITGDRFFALEQGACPSKIYDSMKALRGDASVRNFLPDSQRHLRVDGTTHDVEVVELPSMEVLSESDLECLEETIALLKARGRWHMRDLAHDKAWQSASQNAEMDFRTIAKSLEDGGALSAYLESRF